MSSAFDLLEEPPGEAPEMTPPAAPSERWGGYEIIQQLGRGGMGVVFRARDMRLNRVVALKLLLTGKLASDIEVKRFRTEAEAAARLSHPNIVPIYEVGEEKGAPFFTMKLVGGGTLAAQLAAKVWSAEAGQVQAAKLMATIARAVHFAHQHGILHRDLKPANILLDQGGEPIVSDFGLARRLESSGGGITVSGDLLGTPSYMAPEVTTSGSRQATIASDVYSLGAILYELLTGRPPFAAVTVAALLRKIAEEEPVPPSRARARPARKGGPSAGEPYAPGGTTITAAAVDRDLETICLKCLAKDPGSRYTSAEMLAEDLERWLRGEPILARPVSVWEQGVKWARRKPAWALVSLLMLLAPVAIISLLWAGNARVRRAQGQTRINLYAADMQVAQTVLEDANVGLARQILDSHRPPAGESDLRGFEWRYLWNLARSGQLRVLRAHSQPINCLAFSPDGNWLASSEDGRAAWFWSTTTWKAERVIDWSGPRHEPFRGLSYSPDGKNIAVVIDPGIVTLFDERTLQANWYASGGMLESRPTRALWSPAAAKLAFLAGDSAHGRFTAVLDWARFEANPGRRTADTNSIVFRRESQPGEISGYPDAPILRLPDMDALHSFTAGGTLLASREGKLFELELKPGAEAVPFPSAHQFDYCERSRDGRFQAGFNSLPKDRHSILMDEFLPGTTNYWEIIGHAGDLRCLAISPDSRQILTGSADHTARVWDAKTRKPVADLRGHGDEVNAVAWSPDGRLIATGSRDHTVMLWTAQNTNELSSSSESLTEAFGPWLTSEDGRALSARSGRGELPSSIVVWDLISHRTREMSFNSSVMPIFLSAGGSNLFTLDFAPNRQAMLRSWDVAAQTNFVVRTLVLPPPEAPVSQEPAALWAMSSDQGWLARGDARGTLTLWRLGKSSQVREDLPATNLPITQIVFSPDGGSLAVLHTNYQGSCLLELWTLSRTRLAATIPFQTPVHAVAWSPDGSRLVAACEDHTLQEWQIRSPRLIRTLTGHKRGVTAVAFSPDGRTLASGDGRTIKLWQAATGREMITVYREIKLGDPLRWLAFTADGARLLAGDAGGRVQVFLGPAP